MNYSTRFFLPNIVAAQKALDKEITNCGFTKYKIINCDISPDSIACSDEGAQALSYEFNFEVEVMGFDA